MGAFSFVPVGWGKMKTLLNPAEFTPTLEKNLEKATKLNGMLVRREIRDRVKASVYSPNAKLTIIIKGSSKALVGNADLFNAITDVPIDFKTVFVGVKKAAKGKHGEDLANLAAVLHEGISIPVTEKMRNLFFKLYQVSHGKISPAQLTGRAKEIWEDSHEGIFYPLKAETQHIVIPPRHYFKAVFEDAKVLAQVKKNWELAVEATFKEMASKGGAKGE